MHEIAHDVLVEHCFAGVTVGVICTARGLILVDAPPRPEDGRVWRSVLNNLGGSGERVLVNLDAHFDRTLGARLMDCTVIGHDRTGTAFRNRPTTFKTQAAETGAEWEMLGSLGTIRWAPPEVTFSHTLSIDWDDSGPVILEHHPGPTPGSTWVVIPRRKVAFIGDTVIPQQPPFLANADIPAWLECLDLLMEEPYRSYTLVGGRSLLVSGQDVQRQSAGLRRIQACLEELGEPKRMIASAAGIASATQAVECLLPDLAAIWGIPEGRREQHIQRLRWGMHQTLVRRGRTSVAEDYV
jgi:glyoxylase-like metal-dependent hydrolase (beta-lactamase superfamily II)